MIVNSFSDYIFAQNDTNMPDRKLFFKYLTPAEDDLLWGLAVNVVGFAHVAPNDTYPPQGHPTGYNFNWDNGRILREYQLIYFTDGAGIFETRENRFSIQSGTVLFIYPGTWHRYRPNKNTGWKEHYIGISGDFTQRIFNEKYMSREKPLLYIGFQDRLIKQFHEIIGEVKEEKPGYQQVCAGIAMHLFGAIFSIHKNRDFSGKEIERKIRRACITLRENLTQQVNIENLAEESHLGYSNFRRVFKKYTGVSPAQYHLNLRLQKARELLINTNMSVKQIAFEMGFQSNHYFTRIFTSKVGVSPTVFRKS